MRQAVHIAMIAAVTLTLWRPVVAEGQTPIYVYAQLETPARSWFPIWCDGTIVAKLKRGRFFVVNVAPGRHMLSDGKGVPVWVDAHSGKESFARLDWRMEVGGPAISVLQVIPRCTARGDMPSLTYIDADKALSKSVRKTDPRKREPPRLRRRSDADDE